MWTNVGKPSIASWTNSNPQGKEQYDEASITYDDPNVFYYGVNVNQWTDVSKPTSSVWTKVNKPI